MGQGHRDVVRDRQLTGRPIGRCALELAEIERSTKASRRLRQFHGVVQYATDHDQGRFKAVNKEVARPGDDLRTWSDVIPAQTQVPRPNTRAEFSPRETARSVGLGCHVAKRAVSTSVSALLTDELPIATLTASADVRFSANSKLTRVRVGASKNRFAIVSPRTYAGSPSGTEAAPVSQRDVLLAPQGRWRDRR